MAPGDLIRRSLQFVEHCASGSDEASAIVADDFLVAGRDKAVMNLAEFMAVVPWRNGYEVVRSDESGTLVFVELNELGGGSGTLNTMTIFEFDADTRLRRLDLFQ